MLVEPVCKVWAVAIYCSYKSVFTDCTFGCLQSQHTL